MIRIFLGNVGSGKTACAVGEIIHPPNGKHTFSNIKTKSDKHTLLKPSMIYEKLIVEDPVNPKKKKEVFQVNNDYWKQILKKHGSINIILDEAHSIFNSRRSMSKKNIVMSEWIALARRVVGQDSSGYGQLTFITQYPNKLDVNLRDMATHVRFHLCHYIKTCKDCRYSWREHSEIAEPLFKCRRCGHHNIVKHHHKIEVWHFVSVEAYIEWKVTGKELFHRNYYVHGIESIFSLYDTLQWDNLLSED